MAVNHIGGKTIEIHTVSAKNGKLGNSELYISSFMRTTCHVVSFTNKLSLIADWLP